MSTDKSAMLYYSSGWIHCLMKYSKTVDLDRSVYHRNLDHAFVLIDLRSNEKGISEHKLNSITCNSTTIVRLSAGEIMGVLNMNMLTRNFGLKLWHVPYIYKAIRGSFIPVLLKCINKNCGGGGDSPVGRHVHVVSFPLLSPKYTSTKALSTHERKTSCCTGPHDACLSKLHHHQVSLGDCHAEDGGELPWMEPHEQTVVDVALTQHNFMDEKFKVCYHYWGKAVSGGAKLTVLSCLAEDIWHYNSDTPPGVHSLCRIQLILVDNSQFPLHYPTENRSLRNSDLYK